MALSRRVLRLPDTYWSRWQLFVGGTRHDHMRWDAGNGPNPVTIVAEQLVEMSEEDGRHHADDPYMAIHLPTYRPADDRRGVWECVAILPYCRTFNTPSGNLEPGDVWTGTWMVPKPFRDARGQVVHGEWIFTEQDMVCWREMDREEMAEAKVTDTIITRDGQQKITEVRRR